jgi:hypothetical protein
MADVHVVPRGDQWACEVGGERRSHHATQAEAIKRGGELADQERGELVIHRADGKIREKNSHGNDPRDVPG